MKAEQLKKKEDDEKIKAETLNTAEKENEREESEEEESGEEESQQGGDVDADMSAEQLTNTVIGAAPEVLAAMRGSAGPIDERPEEDVMKAELLEKMEMEEKMKAELLKKAQAEDEIKAEQLKAKQADEEAAKQKRREQLQKTQDNANQATERIAAEEETRNALVDKGRTEKHEKKEKKERKEKKGTKGARGKQDGGDLREWVKGDTPTKRKSEAVETVTKSQSSKSKRPRRE